MEEEAVYSVKKKVYADIRIEIEPMGAVRSNGVRSMGRKSVKRYVEWKESVKWLWASELRKFGFKSAVLPDGVIELLEFGMPVPTGGSSKRKQEEMKSRVGNGHQMKPDLDNLYKGFIDAIFDLTGSCDGVIHHVKEMKKVWVPHGEGYIRIKFKVI